MSQSPPPGALRERIASRDRFNVLATATLAVGAIVGLVGVATAPWALPHHIGTMVIVVGISLSMLWWALDRMDRPERRPDFVRLATFGSTLTILDHVERELQSATVSSVTGWWLTRTWLVSFDDNVRILPIDDVMGVACMHGHKGSLRRRNIVGGTPDIAIWIRDESWYQTVTYLSSETPRAVAEMVGRVHPALAVPDPVAFHQQWREDRAGVQRRVDAALGRQPRE